MWKIIYNKIDDVFDEEYKVEASAKIKEIEETRRKKVEEKKGEEEKKDEEEKKEELSKGEEKDTNGQQEKSVQDTQLPPPSPPHSTITLVEIIKIKDVIDTSCQKINPLTIEDLTKILDQSTQASKLCSSPILVSVDELKKLVVESKEVKVKTQEPPSTTQTTGLLFLPPPSPPKVVIDAL